jgi:CRISPR/Cas system CSM-associated protein Csm3 (group 7 of RAMP superfamily)
VPVAEVQRFPVPGWEKVLYDNTHFSGRLSFEIHTLSPLFVSSGRYALSEDVGLGTGKVVRGFYRIEDIPTIPASSLKGAVRSVAEAVSPSCVTTTRVNRQRLPEGVTQSACTIGSEPQARACPACALFGSGGKNAHIGLVRFEDARLLDHEAQGVESRRLQPLYRPRVSYRRIPQAYLERGGNFRGRKFFFHGKPARVKRNDGDLCEVLPPGSRLAGRLHFTNLDAPLLGVLFFALGLDETFKLKLGGGKPACFGSLEIVAAELHRDTQDGFLQAERGGETKSGETLAACIASKIEAAEQQGRLLQPQMDKLREILRYPNERDCPSGLY